MGILILEVQHVSGRSTGPGLSLLRARHRLRRGDCWAAERCGGGGRVAGGVFEVAFYYFVRTRANLIICEAEPYVTCGEGAIGMEIACLEIFRRELENLGARTTGRPFK